MLRANWKQVLLLFQRNGYSEVVNITSTEGALHTGFVICKACRKNFGCSSAKAKIFVTDLPTENGLYFESSKNSIVEGDEFSFLCAVSRFQYSNITWGHSSNGLLELDKGIKIKYWNSNYSLWSNISVMASSKARHSGDFYCNAESRYHESKRQKISMEIVSVIAPSIIPHSTHNSSIEVKKLYILSCF